MSTECCLVSISSEKELFSSILPCQLWCSYFILHRNPSFLLLIPLLFAFDYFTWIMDREHGVNDRSLYSDLCTQCMLLPDSYIIPFRTVFNLFLNALLMFPQWPLWMSIPLLNCTCLLNTSLYKQFKHALLISCKTFQTNDEWFFPVYCFFLLEYRCQMSWKAGSPFHISGQQKKLNKSMPFSHL